MTCMPCSSGATIHMVILLVLLCCSRMSTRCCCMPAVAEGFVLLFSSAKETAKSSRKGRFDRNRIITASAASTRDSLGHDDDDDDQDNNDCSGGATTTTTTQSSSSSQQSGLYRSFADSAWTKLKATGWFDETTTNGVCDCNSAPAKGFPPGSTVNIEIRTLIPQKQHQAASSSPIQYARYALLETLVNSSTTTTTATEDETRKIQSRGIQVLNLVVFPSQQQQQLLSKTLPVWGADFVSLPGGKHLLLLDAQPMHAQCTLHQHWQDWHQRQSLEFEWGGDFPPQVRRYVSPCALWTRMVESEEEEQKPATTAMDNDISTTTTTTTTTTNRKPVTRIQAKLPSLFDEHLDIYLRLVNKIQQEGQQNTHIKEDDSVSDDDDDDVCSWLDEYLTYRLDNDPARPMLKSLYGEEYTERVLHDLLFPLEQLLPHNQ